MKVILTSDVRNLGKVGDVVSVKNGYARNYLLPKGVARVATERRMKELNHLLSVAKAKKSQIFATRKELLDKLCGIKLTMKARSSHESDKLFGSVTNVDISNALFEKGFEIDKRDVVLKNNIKTIGEHSVKISLGDNLSGDIVVVVEKETDDSLDGANRDLKTKKANEKDDVTTDKKDNPNTEKNESNKEVSNEDSAKEE